MGLSSASRPLRFRSRPGHVGTATGIHLHAIADVHEQRHVDRGARLERRRLVAAARGGVPADARLGVGDLKLDRRRQLDVGRDVVDEQQVDGLVRADPLQRLLERGLRDL
jgi:hypothetical protein